MYFQKLIFNGKQDISLQSGFCSVWNALLIIFNCFSDDSPFFVPYVRLRCPFHVSNRPGHCSHSGQAIIQPTPPTPRRLLAPYHPALFPSGISRWILLEIPLRYFFYKSKTSAKPSDVPALRKPLEQMSILRSQMLHLAGLMLQIWTKTSLSPLIFKTLKNWGKL